MSQPREPDRKEIAVSEDTQQERRVVIQLTEMESAMETESDEVDFSIEDKTAGQALSHEEAELVMYRIQQLEKESEKPLLKRRRRKKTAK